MTRRQTLPQLWLLSDARNDAGLFAAIARLPRGSAVVFRHYHLPRAERYARWIEVRRMAHRFRHWAVLADAPHRARQWGADGIYASAAGFAGHRAAGAGLLRIVTAHSMRELAAARRAGADAVMLSPVFPTRSHPDGNSLGVVRFRLLARWAGVPVIALGGMTAKGAHAANWPRWAAIDGLAMQ
ncbi:MAG: thiamine phosphate synthase [Novosphingobium sp.]|nr:thiamine phosphate synthase [Novosphingobium sp.]